MIRILIIALAALLAACGGDGGSDGGRQPDGASNTGGLVYSFPANEQQQVPVSSPVVLRFSSPVAVTVTAVGDLIELWDDEGNLLEWSSVEEADGGKSLLLYPDGDFSPMTSYRIDLALIDLEDGESQPRSLGFSTRALREGPKSLVAADEFRVIRTIPDGENREVMDFSTFRVQFSHPLDRVSVVYGDTTDATVELAGPDGTVDAHVLITGPYLTIDPKEDLVAGEDYSLIFKSGITSVYGDTLPGGFGDSGNSVSTRLSVTPKDTGPSSTMVQNIPRTAEEPSPLTGKQINEVPVVSTLLGRNTTTQAEGVINAELGYVPNAPNAVPIRVARGSRIDGDSIPVKLGGMIFLYDTGEIRFDFLSDATGYMIPNPYSGAGDAPRQVRLWLDMAITAENPQANGAITQNLQHVALVGIAEVSDDRMKIDAVGVVEPLIQGAEWASGLLSFHMEEALPGDDTDEQEASPASYRLALTGLTEATGEKRVTLAQAEFSGARLGLVEPEHSAPAIMATYPGFACVLKQGSDADRRLDENLAGRCADAVDGATAGDVVPVMPLPANRPIMVSFSNALEPSSVILGQHFEVSEVSENGEPAARNIPGKLDVSGRTITFTPHAPWEAGKLYQYTVTGLTDQPTAGSPDLTQFFRGAEGQGGTVQQFTTEPVGDTENRFTSSMFMEITEEATPEGVKVKIWPSRIHDAEQEASFTMRYPDRGHAEPIIGYVSEENGQPVLKADLDVYVDTTADSYSTTLNMRGEVTVLEDGRLAIEQANTNPVILSGDAQAPAIPKHGVTLNLVAQARK